MTPREKTRAVRVGGITVGGGAPVSIQSMTNTDTRNIPETLAQIRRLTETGCEIIRLAVPDTEAAEAFKVIKKEADVPLIADIHYDYRLALLAIRYGADKLRINPGNIGGAEKLITVADAAKAAGIPIRVGVNGGSLEKGLLKKYGGVTSEALCESALDSVSVLEKCGFYDIVAAIKVSNVPVLVRAYQLFAEKSDCPLHIGLTEAGTPYRGAIRSAVGIGALLCMGLGDTIRVSLTGDPAEEVRCAKEILQATGVRSFGAAVISCPTCGRTEINLIDMAQKVEAYCETLSVPIKVAVMGCVVNGPGEAREADFGLAGGKGEGVLFRKGEIVKKVPEERLAEELIALIQGNAC